MQASYFTENETNKFTSGFTFKQFRVYNTSSLPLYINVGGSVPDAKNFEHYIQPKTEFYSPEVSGQTLNVYFPKRQPSDNIEITIYGDKVAEPKNNPLLLTDSSSYAGYPVTITGATTNYQLPSIYLNSYDNLYLFMADQGTQKRVIRLTNLGDLSDNIYHRGITRRLITPKLIPQTVSPVINDVGSINIGNLYVNVFNTNLYLDDYQYNSSDGYTTLGASSSFTDYYPVYPPYFMFGLAIYPNGFSGSTSWNVNITLYYSSVFGGETAIISARSIFGVASASNYKYAIAPQIYPITNEGYLKLSISNGVPIQYIVQPLVSHAVGNTK